MFLNFFVYPYTDYQSDFYEKSQVVSTYDTNAEYQIRSFCYNLDCSYTDNRPTDRLIAKNVIFGFRGPQNE